jgi:hypothetical protein
VTTAAGSARAPGGRATRLYVSSWSSRHLRHSLRERRSTARAKSLLVSVCGLLRRPSFSWHRFTRLTDAFRRATATGPRTESRRR